MVGETIIVLSIFCMQASTNVGVSVFESCLSLLMEVEGRDRSSTCLSKLNDIYKISDVIGTNYSEPEPCGGLLLSPGHDTLEVDMNLLCVCQSHKSIKQQTQARWLSVANTPPQRTMALSF